MEMDNKEEITTMWTTVDALILAAYRRERRLASI